MKIIVCDDEALARARLVKIAESVGHEVVAEADTGWAAVSAVKKYQPDVILLDINMPEMDGITCADQLNQLPNPPAVIFVTAYEQYAINAFKANAIGYLLKPVSKDDLQTALDKAGHLNAVQISALKERHPPKQDKPSRQHISARTHRGIELIALTDVYYFAADQKYVKVRHKEGIVLVDDTLKELEEELGEELFRIHRNALINLDYLERLEAKESGQFYVHFKDIEDVLAVSRRHVPALRSKIKQM